MKISLEPIAYVSNERKKKTEDNWGKVISEITLTEGYTAECFDSIDQFSHLEIIFHFDRSDKIVTGSEHPRENKAWPKVGIFAQRKKDRPNHIGLTTVKLIKRTGKTIQVSGLDAIDGTPVLDIKPVFAEFLPCSEVIQPAWSKELMKSYWTST